MTEHLAATVGASESWAGKPVVEVVAGRAIQELGSVEVDVDVLVPPVSQRRLAESISEAAYGSRVDEWTALLVSLGTDPQRTHLQNRLAAALANRDLPPPPGMVLSIVPGANGAVSHREIQSSDWIQRPVSTPSFEVVVAPSPAGHNPNVMAAGIFGPGIAAVVVMLAGGGYAWKRKKKVKQIVDDLKDKVKGKDVEEQVKEMGDALSNADEIARGISSGCLTPPGSSIKLAPLNLLHHQFDRFCADMSPWRRGQLSPTSTPSSKRPSTAHSHVSDAVTETGSPLRRRPDFSKPDIELGTSDDHEDAIVLPNTVGEAQAGGLRPWLCRSFSSTSDRIAAEPNPSGDRLFQSPRRGRAASLSAPDGTVVLNMEPESAQEPDQEMPRYTGLQGKTWATPRQKQSLADKILSDGTGSSKTTQGVFSSLGSSMQDTPSDTYASCTTGNDVQPESEPSISAAHSRTASKPSTPSSRPCSKQLSVRSRPSPLESETIEHNGDEEDGADIYTASAGRLRGAANSMNVGTFGDMTWAHLPEPPSDIWYADTPVMHVPLARRASDRKGLPSTQVYLQKDAVADSTSRASRLQNGAATLPCTDSTVGAGTWAGPRKLWASLDEPLPQQTDCDGGKGRWVARPGAVGTDTPAGRRFLHSVSPPARTQWKAPVFRREAKRTAKVTPIDDSGRAVTSVPTKRVKIVEVESAEEQQVEMVPEGTTTADTEEPSAIRCAPPPLSTARSWSGMLEEGYSGQDAFVATPAAHTMLPKLTVERPTLAPIEPVPEQNAQTGEGHAATVIRAPPKLPLSTKAQSGTCIGSVESSPLKNSGNTTPIHVQPSGDSTVKRAQLRRAGLRKPRTFSTPTHSARHCSPKMRSPQRSCRRSPMKRRPSCSGLPSPKVNLHFVQAQLQDAPDDFVDDGGEAQVSERTGAQDRTVPSSTTSIRSWSHANEDYWLGFERQGSYILT